MVDDAEAEILASWRSNAGPWSEAVRGRRIGSRVRVTDRAVVEAVLAAAPRRVLDVGCGEGWLCRALSGAGVEAVGVDAIPELVAQAQALGGGRFECLDYAALAAGGRFPVAFDAVVCNFSLFGAESVERLLAALPAMLRPGGRLVVQTLHPREACGEAPYADGWRPGSWAGFGPRFTAPAPWYFRTRESWLALFERCGLRLVEERAPLDPASGRAASLLLIGERG
ncbi:class I SAM-dependent methyltransferase [Endothiovibrio diazotrophicus]